MSNVKLIADISPRSQQLWFPKNLLLAVPKKGRLYDKSVALLKDIGLDFKRGLRSDIATCRSAPVTLVFLNVRDIPVFVAKGNVDAGIAGRDVIAEMACKVHEELALGFGKCNLSLQAPVGNSTMLPADFLGKRVVTSFPNLTKAYFDGLCSGDTHNMCSSTAITAVSGSVEASVALGLSDCVVDLVETGDTMRAAGLQEVGLLMQTEAVLLSNPNSQHLDIILTVKKRMLGYLTAQKYQMISYNVTKQNLDSAVSLTPGLRSPTITSLVEPGWFAVTAVTPSDELMELMDKLSAVGAQDILTFQFRHCMFEHFNHH